MSPVRRVVAAYGLASLATGLPWPLLLVLVWHEHGDGPHGAWAVGLAGAARMAPYVLCSWAVGSLGDRVRRDRLVRATIALRVVCLAAGALAVAADHTTSAVVACGLAVLVGTPTYPAIAAGLPALTRGDSARATELLVTVEVSAWVVAPALGGLLLVEQTRAWTLPLAVALAAAGLALTTGLRIPGSRQEGTGPAGMIRTVLGCPPAVAALGRAGLLNLVLTAAGLVLLPLSEDVWHTGETGFGAATACLGFGALGAPLVSRLGALAAGAGTMGLALGAVALTPLPWPVLPLLALAGATGVLVESRSTQTLQDVVPDHHRAGALGLMDTVMVGACLVGSVVAPLLAEWLGARLAMGLVASTVVLLVLRRDYGAADEPGDQPARPDPRGAPAVGAARVA